MPPHPKQRLHARAPPGRSAAPATCEHGNTERRGTPLLSDGSHVTGAVAIETEASFGAGEPVEHGPIEELGGRPGVGARGGVEALADVGEEADGGVAEGVGESLGVLLEVGFVCLFITVIMEQRPL